MRKNLLIATWFDDMPDHGARLMPSKIQKNYNPIVVLLTFLIIMLLKSFSVSAQQSYQVNKDASIVADATDEFILTPDLTMQVGSVWNTSPIYLDKSFSFTFGVYLGSKDSDGADGIAFVLQSIGSSAIGGTGGTLGYGNITPSIAVEYDTWWQGVDPVKDHLAIHKNGNSSTPIFPAIVANPAGNIEDGKWHTTTIKWDARTQNLSVYFDGVLKLSYTDNIIENIFSSNPQVYWGFTGGTGGRSNLQKFKVEELNFTNGLAIEAVSTNVTCADGNDGTITLTATGGTAPYEYSIDGGDTFQTGNVLTGIAEGTYAAVVKDYNRFTSSTSVEVIQQNDLPTINSLVGPTEPTSLSSATINMSANITDDNIASAIWDWGNESESDGTVSGSTITGSHTYSAAGVYRVSLTVFDICGKSDTKNFEYVVIYDPEGGFVTGGGWFYSPVGSYKKESSVDGNASFGFVSKYKKGATVPEGQTQFQFQAGNLNFHSTSYEWLVVAGYKAQYKGEGTINGVSGYGFLLSAVDGALKGSDPTDRIRIKIWKRGADGLSADEIIYDNQAGADDAEAITAVERGSIVIHYAGPKSTRTTAFTAESMFLTETLKGQFYNYPTAFSDMTTVVFSLEREEAYVLEVFDMKGALVSMLANGSAEANRLYEFHLRGEGMRDGVYLTRLTTASSVQSTKVVLKR